MKPSKPKKTVKKVIATISSTDMINGRVLIDAPDLPNQTVVIVHLDHTPEPWGTGVVYDGVAHVIGNSPLPEHYALTIEVPEAPKPVTAE